MHMLNAHNLYNQLLGMFVLGKPSNFPTDLIFFTRLVFFDLTSQTYNVVCNY